MSSEPARRNVLLGLPIGSIPLTRADRRQHFGTKWHFLAAARPLYDPCGILGAGQSIFT
jgi:hypothetical protein